MKVYNSIEEVPIIENAVVTLGTFDGVHLGHQKVLQFLKESAKKINGETILFTFHPHPRVVLYPEDHGIELIQSIEDRIKKLDTFGIDHLVLFPFSKEFSRLTATEFVRNILVNKLNVKLMTIGYNHHFGRNREGNIELLRELGVIFDFNVQEIPAFRENEISISSTKIRNLVKKGELKRANDYLREAFSFTGKVIKGDQIGSKIGYPTANLKITGALQILPENGVYAVSVGINNVFFGGMMNIGTRPTVVDEGEKRIEINIFDFNEMIYDQEIRVIVYDRIRSEHSFGSIKELKQQLKNDQKNCLRVLDQLSVRN